MTLRVKPKVSSVVKYQVPEFIRNEHKNFASFLEEYYKFEEQNTGALNIIRKTVDNMDVDYTSPQLLEHLKQTVLPIAFDSTQTKTDTTELIKYIKDFYLSKGTEKSFKFILDQLFDIQSEIGYGKDYVFRTSSNEIRNEKVIVIKNTLGNSHDLTKVLGTTIRQGNVSAFVEGVEVVSYNAINHYILKLNPESIIGTFSTDYALDVTNRENLATLWQADVDNILIDGLIGDSGSLYIPDLPTDLIGGDGINAEAFIDETSTGSVEEVYVDQGGVGYDVGDVVSFTSANGAGTGASAFVTAVDGCDAVVNPTMEIDSCTIVDGGYLYQVGDLVQLKVTDKNGKYPVAKVASVVSTSVQKLRVVFGGQNYINPKIMLKVGASYYTTTASTNIAGTITSVVNVDGITSYPDVFVNGLNATGSLAINVGRTAITGTTITTAGNNYNSPHKVIYYTNPADKIASDVTNAMNSMSVSSAGVSSDATGGEVTSLTVSLTYSGALFPNFNTIYFDVIADPMYGSGASIAGAIVPIMYGKVSGVQFVDADTYRGEFISSVDCYDTETIGGRGEGLIVNMNLRLASVDFVSRGVNYTNPVSSFSGGIGSGAIMFPIINNSGVIQGIYVINGGKNYPLNPTLSVVTSTGSNAVIVPTVVNGSIISVSVTNGGTAYAATDTISVNTGQSHAVLSLVANENGFIKAANVTSSGYGYYDPITEFAPLSLILSISPSGVGSRSAILSPMISANTITEVHAIDGGFGYVDGNHVGVLTATGGNGTGFVADVTVVSGSITSVIITNVGSNYFYGTKILIEGDGIGAVLTPRVFSGVSAANVVSGGSGYNTHTKALVYSGVQTADVDLVVVDGVVIDAVVSSAGTLMHQANVQSVIYSNFGGAKISLTIVGGQITGYTILNAGLYNLTDIVTTSIIGDGTLAAITLNFSNDTKFKWVSSITIDVAGSGYTYAHLILNDSTVGTLAVLAPIVIRNISHIDVTAAGTGYANATLAILGDGQFAKSEAVIEGNGHISMSSISSQGVGYTDVPTLTITDDTTPVTLTACTGNFNSYELTTTSSTAAIKPGMRVLHLALPETTTVVLVTPTKVVVSDRLSSAISNEPILFSTTGSISRLQISNIGKGYSLLPVAHVQSTYGKNARLVTFSGSIGKVKSIKFKNHGVAYTEVPLLTAPWVIQSTSNNSSFRLGELVYDGAFTYPIVGLLPDYTQGPHGYVVGIESDNNLLMLRNVTDAWSISSEEGQILTDEMNSSSFENEKGFGFNTGAILVGRESQTTTKILRSNRANILLNNGAVGTFKTRLTSESGFLSDIRNRLHDGKQIQDYSYFLKTHMDKKYYEDSIKKLVHPAGWKLYGVYQIETSQKIPFNLPIKLDRFGNLAAELIYLIFNLEATDIGFTFDENAASEFTPSDHKFRNWKLILEHMISLYKNIDMDAPAINNSVGYRYRMIEMIYELLQAVNHVSTKQHETTTTGITGGIESASGTLIMRSEDYSQLFHEVTAGVLEDLKFKIYPHEGMSGADVNYPAPNLNYWNYSNMGVGVFGAVTFTQVINNAKFSGSTGILKQLAIEPYLTII